MRLFRFIIFLYLPFSICAHAVEIDINAREYILVDFLTEHVLAAKNENQRMPPSSMSKLMTTYMVFDALKSGRLSLDDELEVSVNAWRRGGAASGGSTMFLEPGSSVKVEDLLRGVIIQSGNDACIVFAEGLSGTEGSFAEAMNAKSKMIGLTNSNFTNSTGLPDPQHYMTAHDLAILSKRLILDFPEFYELYSETSFTYNGITQGNRNPLLYRVGSGADGLKTGYTSNAGYGLTATSIRNGRRLIMVANGMDNIRVRDQDSIKILDWGFRESLNKTLFNAGDIVTNIEMWLGESTTVPVAVQEDVIITIPRSLVQNLDVKVVYDGPIPAPITKGEAIATLEVRFGKGDLLTLPLHSTTKADRLGFFGRLLAAATYFIFGPPLSVAEQLN